MTEENRIYITHLKVTDVPWHRLTTAYGRGTDFPAHLAVLEQMHFAPTDIVVVNVSGRGDKDMETYIRERRRFENKK